MSDNIDQSRSLKIPKLTNTKNYALWHIYVMELTFKDGVLNALTKNFSEEGATKNVTNRFNKMDEKSRTRIVLKLG